MQKMITKDGLVYLLHNTENTRQANQAGKQQRNPASCHGYQHHGSDDCAADGRSFCSKADLVQYLFDEGLAEHKRQMTEESCTNKPWP